MAQPRIGGNCCVGGTGARGAEAGSADESLRIGASASRSTCLKPARTLAFVKTTNAYRPIGSLKT